ncbi:hypothetical protein D3C87_1807120 [compost metagenome]
MLIGQACVHALQLVQAQISSRVIYVSIKDLPSSNPVAALSPALTALSIFLPTSSILSRVSIMIFRGDRSFPVMFAGHTEVHLPHSVQV